MSSKVAGVLSSTKAKRASDRSRGVLDKGTMNNSLKGALLSGLIFPGIGQIALKHYKRGAIIIIAVSISLSIAVMKVVQLALDILEKIQSEGGEISMSTISNAASQVSTNYSSFMFNLVLALMMFCWIIGVIDAYIIGKKKDIKEVSTGNKN